LTGTPWRHCGKVDQSYRVGYYDKERELSIGFVFHPGVGINGDLQPPFYNRTQWGCGIGQPMSAEVTSLYKWSVGMVGEQFPDVGAKNVTAERLHQWGVRDQRNLLEGVSGTAASSSGLRLRCARQSGHELRRGNLC